MKLKRLEVTLAIGCKVNCKYCPQDKLLSRYTLNNKRMINKLSFEAFKIVLNKVERGGLIVFNGMAEPFLNDECATMVEYAFYKGYRIAMATTLVGMKMEHFEKIMKVKFANFILHIPDEDFNSQFDLSSHYLNILKLVHENISIKAYSCHGKPHHKIRQFLKKILQFTPKWETGQEIWILKTY